MATDKKRSRVVFRDLDASTETRPLSIYALDADGKVLASTPVSDKGDFDLKSETVSKASRVVITGTPEGDEAPDFANAVSYHAYDFAEKVRDRLPIELGRNQIGVIHRLSRCTDGTVRHCYPYYRVLDSLRAELTRNVNFSKAVTSAARIVDFATAARSDVATIRPYPIFPRCRPVCDGVVEVWRRLCCCTPWIYLDPRIEELKERLRRIVVEIPKWRRPIPEPDPSPIERAIAETGTVNPILTNAASDLAALTILQPTEQLEYLNARPYLHYYICSCGTPQKVAQGYLRPDGTFHICWPDSFLIFPCWYQYSFVVKQVINGQVVEIYNGVAANIWTGDLSGVDLVTYHRNAVNCGTPDPPVNPNAVYLQDIGDTQAWRLGKPASGINPAVPYTPVFTDGLINPNGVGAGSEPWNRNLGGTLKLRFSFSNSLVPAAKFYRLSYVRADELTTATPTVLPAMTWRYTQTTASGIDILSYALNTLRADMSEIPYFTTTGRQWQSGQYHGEFATGVLAAEGWYVLILELFDGSGNPVTSGSVGFVNWTTETGTTPVPFGKLLIPLYIDNRPCYADIFDVTAPASTGSDPECLYLSGNASQQVAIRYKAGFPDPNFLWSYGLGTHRGLSGPDVTLVSSTVNSALPFDFAYSTVGAMLDDHVRCAFAANLSANAKTTDGESSLLRQATDQIAFSLEQTP